MSNSNTMSVDFEKSCIAGNFPVYTKQRWNIRISDIYVADLYRCIFNSCATLLKYQRSKSRPHIGLKLMDEDGSFIVGVILDFHEAEGDADDTGNWTLSFTFNESDMEGLDDVFDNFSDMFYTVMAQEIRSGLSANLYSNIDATRFSVAAFKVLQEQLDAMSNNSDGRDVEIVMPGVFVASVGFEEGEKVFSITPGHNLKQQIKDDKGLSKGNNVTNVSFPRPADNESAKAA